MWIGSCRASPEKPLSLKWCKSVKALGVHFSYNREVSFQKNFYDKITEIKNKYISGAGEVSLYLVKYQSLKVFFFLN